MSTDDIDVETAFQRIEAYIRASFPTISSSSVSTIPTHNSFDNDSTHSSSSTATNETESSSSVSSLSSPPTSAELLLTGLHQAYNNPPADHLSFILQRSVGTAKTRELLFIPTVNEDNDGIRLYPQLIMGPPVSVSEKDKAKHPARLIQGPFLSLLLLYHLRNWTNSSVFIRSGGLYSLVHLFTENNLYIRSHAMDVFMQLISHPDFDWFEDLNTPTKETNDNHKEEVIERQELHQHMLNLYRTPFLQSLMDNSTVDYPGGSYIALQIFAFWTSWIRKFYCEHNILKLSKIILDRLHQWYQEHTTKEPNSRSKEELELAKTLYEDFIRFGPAEDNLVPSSSSSTTTSSSSSSLVSGVNTASTSHLSTVPAPIVAQSSATSDSSVAISTDPYDQAVNHKNHGNTYFKDAKWLLAIETYTNGIDTLRSLLSAKASSSNNASSTTYRSKLQKELITLLSNRSVSFLRASHYGSDLVPSPQYLLLINKQLYEQPALRTLLESSSSSRDSSPTAASTAVSTNVSQLLVQSPENIRYLFRCIMDTIEVLNYDTTHVKALFRKAQALLALGQIDDAIAVTRACLAACRLSSIEINNSSSTDNKTVKSPNSKRSSLSMEEKRKNEITSDMENQASKFLIQAIALQGTYASVYETNKHSTLTKDEGKANDLSSVTSTVMTTKRSNEGDNDEDEDDAILAALLHRNEFGGNGVVLGDQTLSNEHSSISSKFRGSLHAYDTRTDDSSSSSSSGIMDSVFGDLIKVDESDNATISSKEQRKDISFLSIPETNMSTNNNSNTSATLALLESLSNHHSVPKTTSIPTATPETPLSVTPALTLDQILSGSVKTTASSAASTNKLNSKGGGINKSSTTTTSGKNLPAHLRNLLEK